MRWLAALLVMSGAAAAQPADFIYRIERVQSPTVDGSRFDWLLCGYAWPHQPPCEARPISQVDVAITPRPPDPVGLRGEIERGCWLVVGHIVAPPPIAPFRRTTVGGIEGGNRPVPTGATFRVTDLAGPNPEAREASRCARS